MNELDFFIGSYGCLDVIESLFLTSFFHPEMVKKCSGLTKNGLSLLSKFHTQCECGRTFVFIGCFYNLVHPIFQIFKKNQVLFRKRHFEGVVEGLRFMIVM